MAAHRASSQETWTYGITAIDHGRAGHDMFVLDQQAPEEKPVELIEIRNIGVDKSETANGKRRLKQQFQVGMCTRPLGYIGSHVIVHFYPVAQLFSADLLQYGPDHDPPGGEESSTPKL